MLEQPERLSPAARLAFPSRSSLMRAQSSSETGQTSHRPLWQLPPAPLGDEERKDTAYGCLGHSHFLGW